MDAPDLHVRGTILPGGLARELWIRDGTIVEGPLTRAAEVAGGWILPGLIDAHCHVGLGPGGAVERDEQERQALTDRDTGVLLLRDAGSAADTRWIDDRPDLPRIVRAGRHLARPARYIRDYAHEIEPSELVAYVEQEVVRGDGWVKLVGDWIDREAGDLSPLWPRDALDAAIGRAHELGARVTAHVFGEDALPDLLGAGIDCIEHGTGLSDDLIALMAERGTALVPTRVQVDNFPSYAEAGQARFPTYAAHMRALHARVDDTLHRVYEAGVPVYAGTDAGGVLPHGLVAREVVALADSGMAAADALAVASWAGRAWLGRPYGLAVGDPADLVVYDADPRAELAVLGSPRRVVLRGRVVL